MCALQVRIIDDAIKSDRLSAVSSSISEHPTVAGVMVTTVMIDEMVHRLVTDHHLHADHIADEHRLRCGHPTTWTIL